LGLVENYTIGNIQVKLGTLLLGKRMQLHPQVGSTNDLIREAGREGAPEGLVILAEEQVRGKGRLGRTWTAPPGSSILCSVLLRPRFPPQQGFYLTIAASLAILRAIRKLTVDGRRWTVDDQSQITSTKSAIRNPKSAIKWPNDVLLNGRKVAGVLCESEFNGGEWAFAVVGFGINVNLPREKFGELRARATSLSAELGHEIDRAALLALVLDELEASYLALQDGQMQPTFQAWADALETLGKKVTVSEPGGKLTGVAMRVDSDGVLIVKTDAGTERRVLAGDVS
jgi:BirA family transcriptional regulator, biotin operon repressor / biotin---[acetyl-CoA-carboxylase] ligase